MLTKLRGLLVVAGAGALAWIAGTESVQAQQQVFLEIPGVQGEATAIGFANQIVVLSASFVAANPACAKAGLTVCELTFTKRTDKATVDLYTAVRDRTAYPLITFRFADPSGTVYQKFELANALFSSSAAAGSAGDLKNVESWTVSFSQVIVTYTFIDASGKPGATETTTLIPSVCPGS